MRSQYISRQQVAFRNLICDIVVAAFWLDTGPKQNCLCYNHVIDLVFNVLSGITNSTHYSSVWAKNDWPGLAR